MEFYKDYDNKPLWDFVKMKEDDKPKILVLAGPYCSGKSTLSKLLLKEIKSMAFRLPINPNTDCYRFRAPDYRSVLLVREEKNLEWNFYKHCLDILKKHINFWPMFTNYGMESQFNGNQCILENASDVPIIINNERIAVINLKEIENRIDEKIVRSCNFKAWLVGFDQACILAITMILVYRNNNLSQFPKDVIRMLIVEIIRESYRDYWEKDFCEMVKL
jgi:hypothetical protein